jgi:hypothetical protein
MACSLLASSIAHILMRATPFLLTYAILQQAYLGDESLLQINL